MEIGHDCQGANDFKPEGRCFSGEALVGISANPDGQYIYGELSPVTVGKILRMLGSKLQLPPAVEQSGFPKGLTVSRHFHLRTGKTSFRKNNITKSSALQDLKLPLDDRSLTCAAIYTEFKLKIIRYKCIPTFQKQKIVFLISSNSQFWLEPQCRHLLFTLMQNRGKDFCPFFDLSNCSLEKGGI